MLCQDPRLKWSAIMAALSGLEDFPRMPWSQLQPYFLNMRHLRLKRRVMSTEKVQYKSGVFRLDAKTVNKELIV